MGLQAFWLIINDEESHICYALLNAVWFGGIVKSTTSLAKVLPCPL
jgi:hypothetical protein